MTGPDIGWAGGGYYDRWLEGFSGFTAGLCRGRFLQEKLPREALTGRLPPS
jgi:5-formyltetrahydrofolate cyclo-ligase